MSTRPIEITSENTESMDISFIFNYPILTNQSFKVRAVSSDSTMGLNGLQVSLENITTKKAVLLDKVFYYFDSFYISRGADDVGTDGYSVLIKNKSITDSESNLYIIIPFEDNEDSMKDTPSDFSTLKSSINTYSNEISGNTNYINVGNLDLNLNSLINTDDTFYKYTINNNTVISLKSGPISLNMSDLSFSQFFNTQVATSEFEDGTVYDSTSFPINMDLNVLGFQDDIYIDCSPVGSGTENEIIKPKKVFSIKPLVNIDNIGDAGSALLFLFILIIIGGCSKVMVTSILKYVYSIINTKNEGKSTNSSDKTSFINSKSTITKGIILIFAMIIISILYTITNPNSEIISNQTLITVFSILIVSVFVFYISRKFKEKMSKTLLLSSEQTKLRWNKRLLSFGLFVVICIVFIILYFFYTSFTNSIFNNIKTWQLVIFILSFISLVVLNYYYEMKKNYSIEEENL